MSKKMSRAEAFAPNRKLPNRLEIRPTRMPYIAMSVAQNPAQWEEIPVQENLFGGIIDGHSIKLPIVGREHGFVCDYLECDLQIIVKIISYLSARASVRVFREAGCRLFLCSDADDATIQAAVRYAGNEVFGMHTPYRTLNTTPQGTVRMSGNIPE